MYQGRHLLHRGKLRHQHLRPHRPRLENCPLDQSDRGRFLSTGWVKENIFEFNALVLRVSGVDKNCRVKDWKQFCDMLIKWDGKKFTYKPL